MESSKAAYVNESMSFYQNPSMSHFQLPYDDGLSAHSAHSFMEGDSTQSAHSFMEGDSQLLDRDGAAPGGKASRANANNEVEMRGLFHLNRHKTLDEVATELHGNERGPNSERQRQVFAMIWINLSCRAGKGSIPRGRVYANYAARCAAEKVTVLNPASFGKLVRVLFPGLKTRRLGVRGESKYHYVDFAFKEDQNFEASPKAPSLPLPENIGAPQRSVNSTLPRFRPPRVALPSPEIGQEQEPRRSRSRRVRHSLYNYPFPSTLAELRSHTSKTVIKHSLAPDSVECSQSDALVLPSIEPYLPSNTDPDAAKSLVALYLSHCTSLVECIRYCKEKTFFHLFTSFQGTLTMPVQKLFAHPSVAAWIERSDFILYQRMMRILSTLALQVVPKPVLDTLTSISQRLVPHIRESFHWCPEHVARAKEAPAAIFAALLSMELRVNLTAHAAANMLSNPANRAQMYTDFITMVQPRKIVECLPTRAMDEVTNILLGEFRDFLAPITIPWEVEARTLHGEMRAQKGIRADDDSTTERAGAYGVLDAWLELLHSLPERFPYAAHSDIVWCVHELGTAITRELTISQGSSFGAWWVTKVWIDEMISFLALQNGFLKMTSSADTDSEDEEKHGTSNGDGGLQDSHCSPGEGQVNMSQSHAQSHSHSQPDRAPFPAGNHLVSQEDGSTGVNPDDSGIGIRTPDEEFSIEKLDFSSALDGAVGLL